MVYSAPHGLLTILGDAFTGAEIWQTGVRLVGTDPPTADQFAAINTAVQTFLNAGFTSLPSGRRYIGLKWAPQGVDGKYPPGATATEWFRPTPHVGTAGTGYPQIAVVLSLRTARVRGRGSNGRMYFPNAQAIVAADGRLPVAAAESMATAGAQLIGSIRSAGAGSPAVMSAVDPGLTEQVTGVRVGRVMDTQRRRSNGLDEGYTAAVAVPLA